MYKISFSNVDHDFIEAVRNSVDDYFLENRLSRTGNAHLYLKAVIFIPLALATYCFLLWGTYSPLLGLALLFVLTISLISIAFNIMHDACHGSYSGSRGLNDLMGLTMNALGGNAFLWKLTHNVIHHTYTNIDGVDHDIANWPLLRQSPTQPWRPVHRIQHWYMFLLYAIQTIAWMLVLDFQKYFTRKVATTPIKRMSTREHIMFWVSKLLYALFYIGLPIYFVGWQVWLIGFAILHVTFGLVVTIVFQLAHVVEMTSFEKVGDESKTIATSWAVHEVMTTANFAPNNKLLNWFLGGLNFQIEHHLFPQVSHIHYPYLSKIVRVECEKFNIPYHSYQTLYGAVISHVRFMKQLGRGNRT